ncbi:MAG: phosphatase PAP2 family protein [Deltaproteobacteria bacterium]|nr:phosphatase PAP2 family protein [Deltaproteobacteria bacterium]
MVRKANGIMAMTLFLRIGLGLAVLLLPFGHRCIAADNGVISRGYEAVTTDLGNFYLDRSNLTKLGIGIAGAAVFANTGIDRYIRNKYQDSLRSHETDEATKIFNITGTALVLVTVPAYIGTYGAGLLLHNPTMKEWAQKSLRATIVGGPALVFLATAAGADRPTEGNSHWKPFQNIHGVSGHAYIGGIPFITAAKMSENPYQKAIFYGLSTFTGLSRINDDKHYFSQAALGWFLAYLSCDVVEKGNVRQEGRVDVQFAAVPKGIAVTFQKRY